MRRLLVLLLILPVISAYTNWYSMKARVLCHGAPYYGEAEMMVDYGLSTPLAFRPFSYKTLVVVDGWLNATIESSVMFGIGLNVVVYHMKITHECYCPPNTVHNTVEHDTRTSNHHDSKEDSEAHPWNIGVIELSQDCPGFLSG
uniref:Secreted protein n=1 Tax=Panagrellus redivivus TaxID=6233 RepID=A0A7E5A0N7_PANRE